MSQFDHVFVTGGAGYVGAVLVPKLLDAGHRVTVLDWLIFGDQVLNSVADNPHLTVVRGDLRDRDLLERHLPGCDAVIHLACVSNDPSFDLDPALGKSINYDAHVGLVEAARNAGVKRFVFASSSSVYGIRDETDVTEDLEPRPLTDYSKYKALGEQVLLESRRPGFAAVIFRPATVCGYSPRMRLDLTVNILTNHAVNTGQIKVFGGRQMRPNIHIDDVTDLYVQALEWPDDAIDGQVFNAGYENHRVSELAEMISRVVDRVVEIITTPTDDHRSYYICSDKIRRCLNYEPRRTIEQAVQQVTDAFAAGKLPNPMTDAIYYNVKRMQELQLA